MPTKHQRDTEPSDARCGGYKLVFVVVTIVVFDVAVIDVVPDNTVPVLALVTV